MGQRTRLLVDEVYVDDDQDIYLTIKKIDRIRASINPKKERIVLIIVDELRRPKKNGGRWKRN